MVESFDSRLFFLLIVAMIAAERLFELWLSARNARRTLARGGVETARGHHLVVVGVHTAWILGAPLEVFLLDRPFVAPAAVILLVLLVLCMGLRYWAVTTLGDRWNTRVITLPGAEPENGGPFRYFSHPNYAAAYVEAFALPLLHGAWLTAAVLGTVNVVAIHLKSREEDRALGRPESVGGAR